MELEGSADRRSPTDWLQGLPVRLYLQVSGSNQYNGGYIGFISDGRELVTAGYGMLLCSGVSFCFGNLLVPETSEAAPDTAPLLP